MPTFKTLFLWTTLTTLCFACTPKTNELVTPDTPTTPRTTTQAQPITQIFLVRHAEKSKNDPRDPDLTEEGRARAERLKYHLLEANITKIYSTDYNRTRQTVQPLAEALGLEIIIYNPDLVDIAAHVKETQEGNIVIAGHSNTTPKLVNKIIGMEKYASLDESVYNTLFVIAKSVDQCTATVLRY